jgi:hypothetical protein
MNELKFDSQICTTMKQSKRLLELGLKPETADMCIDLYYEDEPFVVHNKIDYSKQTEFVPAWSLHRLIEILDSPLIEFNVLSYNPYEEIIYIISECIEKGYISKKYLKR